MGTKTITLKEDGTFEHVWIHSVHEIPSTAIEVSVADYLLLVNNPDSKRYDIAAGTVVDYVPPFVLADAKTIKLAEINSKASAALGS